MRAVPLLFTLLAAVQATQPVPPSPPLKRGQRLEDLPAGRYTVRVQRSGSLPLQYGCGVKAIYRQGRDITDTVADLASGEELGGVQVVLTDRLSTVSGQLVDQKGAPVADDTVLVFADDLQRWTDGSRWVAAARPDQRGQYQFRGLPAGPYLAIALDYVEEGIWNDAALPRIDPAPGRAICPRRCGHPGPCAQGRDTVTAGSVVRSTIARRICSVGRAFQACLSKELVR
jgi:hypothetical protein